MNTDETPAAASGTREDTSAFSLLLVCFFLSGLAALLYQTAWMRQFAIVFGTSELAIATVLSAYMAGLAIGAWLAGRFEHRIKRPLLAYGILEFWIAAGALLIPWGLSLARWIMTATIGGQPNPPDAGGWMQPSIYVVTTFVILFVPTACMGATLPLLARHAVLRKEQIGSRIGLLYAINTLGAVVGTVLAAFVLLPSLGLFRTTLCGVFVNVLVFAVAAWLGRHRPMSFDASTDSTSSDGLPRWYRGFGLVMPLMLVSGFVSFTYEVLWARLLGHIIGGSVHGFATMLATFLIGITFGSAVASRFASSRRSALLGLAIAQIGTALLSMLMYEMADWLPGWRIRQGSTDMVDPVRNALWCSMSLLPSTLCIGATFPFAVRAVSDEPRLAAVVSAKVYAWNTIGAVFGSITAAFFVIPELGFSGTARIAVGVNLFLAAIALMLVLQKNGTRLIAVAALAVVALIYRPQPPQNILGSSPFSAAVDTSRPVYLGIGRSSTVRVGQRLPQAWTLSNNGLPEAGFVKRGVPPSRDVHQWLSALPAIARPDARSMLVVGFGSGVVIQDITPTITEIDVIELEPEVIRASEEMADVRRLDPLSDPRVTVINNDARGALSLTDKKYDIIISQPSHPWTAGASHLYTREFLELASEHLTDDGIFLQWMGTYLIDDSLFKTLGKTVLEVFPRVRVYRPGGKELMFLASRSEIRPEDAIVALTSSGSSAALPSQFRRLGIHSVSDVAAQLLMSREVLESVCRDSPINTDDHNRLAFARRVEEKDENDENSALNRLLNSADMLMDPESEMRDGTWKLPPTVLAESIYRHNSIERVKEWVNTIRDPAVQAMVSGIVLMYEASPESAVGAFFSAWDSDKANADAAFLMCNMARLTLAKNTPEMFEPIVESLPEDESVALQAVLAVMREDYGAVRDIDDRLSLIPPSTSCFVRALEARVAWRVGIEPEEDAARLGAEALTLVDEAITIVPNRRLFMYRLEAAIRALEVDVALETALSIVIAQSQNKAASGMAPSFDAERVRLLLDSLSELTGEQDKRRKLVLDYLKSLEAGSGLGTLEFGGEL